MYSLNDILCNPVGVIDLPILIAKYWRSYFIRKLGAVSQNKYLVLISITFNISNMKLGVSFTGYNSEDTLIPFYDQISSWQ